MFLGPFDPPFYELGNFVKILDPLPIPKKFPSEIWELCEFFLTPIPPFGNFPQKIPCSSFEGFPKHEKAVHEGILVNDVNIF